MAKITGRDRNHANPFWATSVGKMTEGGQAFTRGLWRLILRSPSLKLVAWPGSGWRTGSKEHGEGRSLDIVITADTGRNPTAAERKAALELLSFLQQHYKAIGIQHILFSRDGKPRTESWNPTRSASNGGPGWKNLANRGSISANHVDHLHVYLKAGAAGWADSLDKIILGEGTPVPIPPPAKWDGVSFPGVAAFQKGKKHEAVGMLQRALVALNYWPGGIDSYWGTLTQSATAAFQRAQGWRGKDADGMPGPETWKRLMAQTMPPKPEGEVWGAFAAWNLQNPDLASSIAAGVPRNAKQQGAYCAKHVKASVYLLSEVGKGELEKFLVGVGRNFSASAHPNGCTAVVYDHTKWAPGPARSLWFNKDNYRGAHCLPLVHTSGIGVDAIAVHILPGNAGGTDEVKRQHIQQAADLSNKWSAVLGGDFNTKWPQTLLSGWTLATLLEADTMDSPGTQALDAILTKRMKGSRNAQVLKTDLSDHYVVRTTIRIN